MEVMELARELGLMLKKTDVMKRADAAEAAFHADSELQADIAEYNAQQKAMEGVDDEEARKAVRERLDALYGRILSRRTYGEYLEAHDAVGKLMNEVNEEINFAITGEHSCGGNCFSCGGCH